MFRVLAANVINKTTPDPNFKPIGSVFRDDADINLFFLQGNGIMHLQPVDDPWYKTSTTPVGNTTIEPGSARGIIYLPSEAASPLGCVDQYQFCESKDNSDKKCGPLASWSDAMSGAAPLFDTIYDPTADYDASTLRSALFHYFIDVFSQSPRKIHDILVQLGPKALQSQKSVLSGYQTPLPVDQWQADVKYWFDISIALTQAAFLDAAVGTTDPTLLQLYDSYLPLALDQFCSNQV